MKTKLLTLCLSLAFSTSAFADYGEIDLIVKESVESHFRDDQKSVDLSTFEYQGQPRTEGSVMTLVSSVWAEQRQVAPYWGWHECVTRIQIQSPGRYTDLGSDCQFQFD
jgi:hypothetical protein